MGEGNPIKEEDIPDDIKKMFSDMEYEKPPEEDDPIEEEGDTDEQIAVKKRLRKCCFGDRNKVWARRDLFPWTLKFLFDIKLKDLKEARFFYTDLTEKARKAKKKGITDLSWRPETDKKGEKINYAKLEDIL